MTETNFTLDGYRTLIKEFRRKDYRVVGFSEVDPEARHLILRHDIDMDLERALTLAEVEAGMNVAAYYFVLLNTELYNSLSARSRAIMSRMIELGHHIGLHFDAAAFPSEPSVLEAAATTDCAILEGLIGQPVEFISFHRPAPFLQGLKGRFADRLHAYEPRFFSQIGYCSDSEGRWRFGHPLDHEAVIAGRALQLVTHPVWWCADAQETEVSKLQRVLDGKREQLADEMARNCKPYRAVRGKAGSVG